MPTAPRRAPDVDGDLTAGLLAIRAELELPDSFPPEVETEASAAADRGPIVPPASDRRDLPLLTIDPPGSRDLDQALAIEASGDGFVVHYAIADVSAFVAPGGAVDLEARRRAVTVYLPDGRVPLHPTVLSEGAASLLAGKDRPAVLWRLKLDSDGELVSTAVERSQVRSRRQLTYDEAQDEIDGAGDADSTLRLLREVGRRREALEATRGGVSLPLPEQIIQPIARGYEVRYRAPLPVEGWNAQISLLTGIAAARLMLDGGVGILRTLPPPTAETVDALRRQAGALGIPWPDPGYAAFIRSLEPARPDHAALLTSAARLLRGAGYLAFDGEAPVGDISLHAAVASPYAHVTAPLRRLVDRFANEIVLALHAEQPPPAWALESLDELPALMQEGRSREGAADRMAVDLVEAVTLAGCVGQQVEGTVLKVDKGGALVQLVQPAVVATVRGTDLSPGEHVVLRVTAADPVARTVSLVPVS